MHAYLSVDAFSSRTSLGAVRKLKDTTNQYLWQPGLNGATATSSLLGYPVFTCDAMPSVAGNAFPILFGNWYRGYLLTVINDIRITVDDNITQPGYVKYYVRRRVGGIVKNNDSIKALRTTWCFGHWHPVCANNTLSFSAERVRGRPCTFASIRVLCG